MTVNELIETGLFNVINVGETDKKIEGVFCCDLLSIAMGKAPAGSAWVTVMSNLNTLAVASLTECACVILAEGVNADENLVKKAVEQEITLLGTEMPIFEAALKVHESL